nr:protein kinase [Kofleriaceae bacterium]
MIGHTIGGYTIERELGRGGMGVVYLGRHAVLGRRAAVKLLLPDLSRQDTTVQRFFAEARAATAIHHPSIVEVYDSGVAADGSAYIAMELCIGETLGARIRRDRVLPVRDALAVARSVAEALAAAHAVGIVHRDLKPDNVFVVDGDGLKLLDFGIAKLAGDAAVGVAKTSTGAIMGTPVYMSPEQCRGAGQVDHRSDLYSLGCMLYEMVCGRVPFIGEGAGDVIGAHLLLAPAAPHTLAPELDPAVEALVMRLLAKRPDDRPATAMAVVDELTALLTNAPATAAAPSPANSGVRAMAPTLPSDAGIATAPTSKPSTVRGYGADAPPPAPPAVTDAPRSLAPGQAGAWSAHATTPPRRRGAWPAVAAAIAAVVTVAVVVAATRHHDEATPGPPSPPGPIPPAPAPGPPAPPPIGPDTATVIVGPMGGTATQKASADALVKADPTLRVVLDRDPLGSASPPERTYALDAENIQLTTTADKVTCRLELVLAAGYTRDVIASMTTGATVHSDRSGSALDSAREDCATAAIADVVRKVPSSIADRAAEAKLDALPIGTVHVEGPLAEADVARVLHAADARFQRCYAVTIRLNGLVATARLRFAIGTDGTASGTVDTSDPALADCIEHEVTKLQFPKPADVVTVHDSISFKP